MTDAVELPRQVSSIGEPLKRFINWVWCLAHSSHWPCLRIAGLLLTGGMMGRFSALNSAMIWWQGESAVGTSVAEPVPDQLPIMSYRKGMGDG